MVVEADAQVGDDAFAQAGDEEEAHGRGRGQDGDHHPGQDETGVQRPVIVQLAAAIDHGARGAADGEGGGAGDQQEQAGHEGVRPVRLHMRPKLRQRAQIAALRSPLGGLGHGPGQHRSGAGPSGGDRLVLGRVSHSVS